VAAALDVTEAARLDPELVVARRAAKLMGDWRALGAVEARRFDEAAAIWKAELAEAPADPGVLHRLALLFSREASALDPGPAAAEDVWSWAIACWAAVLHSPAFRVDLCRRTGRAISDEDAAAARQAVAALLTQDLRDRAHAHPPGPYRDLEVRLGLELRVASLIAELAPGRYAPGWPAGFACGPQLLKRLLTISAGEPIVSALRAAQPRLPGEAGERLRQLLSATGRQRYLLDERRYSDAIAELEAMSGWPEAGVLLAEALLARARELHAAAGWDDALACVERAAAAGADLADVEPLVADASIKRAREILDADDEDYATAVRVLELGLRLLPGHAGIKGNLGATYAQLSRQANNRREYERAVELVRHALLYAPDDDGTRHFAQVAHANLASQVLTSDGGGDADRAIALLKEALGFEADEETSKLLSSVLFQRAREMAIGRRRGEAVALMREEIEFDPEARVRPTEEEAKRRLGNVLFTEAARQADEERYAQAVDLLQEARWYDDDQPTRLHLAISLFRAGRPDESIELLRSEARSSPGNTRIVQQLEVAVASRALELAEARQVERGIRLARAVLAERELAGVRNCLIQICNRAERYEEAIAAIGDGLTRDPSIVERRRWLCVALHNRGVQLANEDRHDEAISYFKQALRIENEQVSRRQLAQALGMRAAERARSGNRWGAREDLEEAVRYDPANETLRRWLQAVRQ
jgi:tetratricopeptide (TPR) repeat protein